MNPFDRVVAGLSCRDVLNRLSDFLDGDLAPEERSAVLAHLAGCSACESFGGQVQQLIVSLRASAHTSPVPHAVSERLRQRLGSGAS